MLIKADLKFNGREALGVLLVACFEMQNFPHGRLVNYAADSSQHSEHHVEKLSDRQRSPTIEQA